MSSCQIQYQDSKNESDRLPEDQEMQWSILFKGKYQPKGFQAREQYLQELRLKTMRLNEEERSKLKELRGTLGQQPSPWESKAHYQSLEAKYAPVYTSLKRDTVMTEANEKYDDMLSADLFNRSENGSYFTQCDIKQAYEDYPHLDHSNNQDELHTRTLIRNSQRRTLPIPNSLSQLVAVEADFLTVTSILAQDPDRGRCEGQNRTVSTILKYRMACEHNPELQMKWLILYGIYLEMFPKSIQGEVDDSVTNGVIEGQVHPITGHDLDSDSWFHSTYHRLILPGMLTIERIIDITQSISGQFNYLINNGYQPLDTGTVQVLARSYLRQGWDPLSVEEKGLNYLQSLVVAINDNFHKQMIFFSRSALKLATDCEAPFWTGVTKLSFGWGSRIYAHLKLFNYLRDRLGWTQSEIRNQLLSSSQDSDLALKQYHRFLAFQAYPLGELMNAKLVGDFLIPI